MYKEREMTFTNINFFACHSQLTDVRGPAIESLCSNIMRRKIFITKNVTQKSSDTFIINNVIFSKLGRIIAKRVTQIDVQNNLVVISLQVQE
jgi:hypothetical protein